MTTLIKRYANRKLYNTATSRYITLRGISELLEDGADLRVVDNESGEDITAVTLSQILVDSGRGGRKPSNNLLNELFSRGGELYEAIRRVSDDASEGIEEFQRNVRRMIRPPRERASRDWIAFGPPDFEKIVQRALERVTAVLDLPRRSDIEALRQRLDQLGEQLDELRVGTNTQPRKVRDDTARASSQREQNSSDDVARASSQREQNSSRDTARANTQRETARGEASFNKVRDAVRADAAHRKLSDDEAHGEFNSRAARAEFRGDAHAHHAPPSAVRAEREHEPPPAPAPPTTPAPEAPTPTPAVPREVSNARHARTGSRG